jgi:hypothetical protein
MATLVAMYAAVAEPADCQCSRQPALRPLAKVKRAWSSVHSRVEATVMIAFETAQGIVMASSVTAKLDRTPTPPPEITNRRKEATGPRVAEVAVSGFRASGDFMAGSPLEAQRLLEGQRLRAVMSRTAEIGVGVSKFCIVLSFGSLFLILEKLRCVHKSSNILVAYY